MAKIVWDKVGERKYETGCDRGVLYVKNDEGGYENGVAWNGLTGVDENPSGAEPTPSYADNMKYLNLISAEEFAATISAYTYPEEFEACDGSASIVAGVTIGQQPRKGFGFSYRTKIGNDVSRAEHGYKLHVVYDCMAAPSAKSYQTINESPEAITFSWEVTTTATPVEGYGPTSKVTIDSTKISKATLTKVENYLYGGDSSGTPMLPSIDELIALVKTEA